MKLGSYWFYYRYESFHFTCLAAKTLIDVQSTGQTDWSRQQTLSFREPNVTLDEASITFADELK